MRRNPSIKHLEDEVILAHLDGELSRATARKAKQHLESCWYCRSVAAELELLVQTAYALLAGRDEADAAQTDAAKGEFLTRKAKIDATLLKKLRQSTSMLFQRPLALIGNAVPASLTALEHGTILSSK
jgi:anti-sigma factor RsiW